MTTEVIGSAQVLIEADFSDFDETLQRRLVSAARKAGNDAEKALKRSGAKAGKEFSDGVSKAASSTKTLDSIRASVERLETAARRAGDVQEDAAGRVRVAEAALAKVKEKSANDSARILAAEERLAKARRDAARADNLAATATRALNAARDKLAQESARQGQEAGEAFSEGLERATRRGAKDAGEDGGNFFVNSFRTAAARSIGTGLFRGLVASSAGLLTALSPLSTLLGGATAAVVALAGALGTASGAAISLGGVLGSLGLAAAAVKVGFSGVGDAMKAQSKAQQELAETGEISTATQEKLDAALKKLAPSAAAVVRQLGAMAPAWQAVARNVQERLFAGVSVALANLGNRFLPILNRQLGITAGVLNRTTLGFARFLNTSTRANQISLIFGRLNSILQTLLAPLTTVSAGFLDIFQASLPFAQELANVLSSLGTSFGQFLSQSAASGTFAKFMETATATAADLFRLLGNIGRIIGTVFGAGSAAGANLLDVLGDLTGAAAQFLQSAEGQSALASFFGLIGQAGQVLISVFTALQPLLSGIGSLFDALKGPVATLGAALSGVIGLLSAQLGNALTKLGPVLGQLVTALAPVVTILGGVLNGVLQALVPVIIQLVTAFARIVPVLTPLISIIGAALVNSISQLAGLLVQIIPIWAQLIAAIATGLQPVLLAIQPVLSQLVTAFVQLVTALLPILVSLLPLIPAFAQLSLAATQLVLALTPLIVSILGAVASQATQLAPIIAKLVPIVLRLVQSFVDTINVLTRVVSAVVSFVVQVIAKFNDLRGQVISAVSAMISGIVSFFSGLPGKITGFMTSFSNAVKTGADKVQSFFADLPSKIVSALSGLGGKLRQAAVDAMNGLIGGLEGALGRVRSVASSIAGAITGPVGKLLKISSPSKVMMALGAFAGEGLANGLLAQISRVSTASQRLADAVPKQIETAAVVTDSRVQQNKTAETISAAVAPAFVDLGGSIVTGFLAALQAQSAALDTQMTRLADVMVARVLELLQALNLPGVNTLQIPGFKDGGVISRDSLIRAGEGNKPEVMIPLTKPKRAQELLDSTGLSALVSARGKPSRTVEVPIHVGGNLVDYDALTAHIEGVLQRYGFMPKLGLTMAGGTL